jgi:hypothetical protein
MALFVASPTSGHSDLYEARADGTVGRVARDGEPYVFASTDGARVPLRMYPGCIEEASPGLALVAWVTGRYQDDPFLTTLVRKLDGAVIPVGDAGFVPSCELDPYGWRPGVQPDGTGRLYVQNTVWTGGVIVARRTLSTLDPVTFAVDELLRPDDDVESFVVNASGDVAFRGDSSGAHHVPDVQVFRSAAGDYTTASLDPALGDVWVGMDGELHATRATGDASGTVELVRLEIGATVTEVPTASWQGAPTHLRGHPLRLGGSLFFPEADRIWEVAALDAPPVEHLLDFTWDDVAAGDGVLWFTSERQPAGDALGLTRWTPAGRETVIPADGGFRIDRVFAVDDGSAIVSGSASLDGGPVRGLVARVDASGTVTPVPVGEGPAAYTAARMY